jgi:hypothetical protein
MRIIKSLFLAFMCLVLAASVAMAANTVTRSGLFIEIIPDGSTDWDSQVDLPGGVSLVSVAFYPSAANDVIKLREKSASGPAIMNAKDTGGGGLIQYFDGGVVYPYLKAADCTFGTPANVRIILKIR